MRPRSKRFSINCSSGILIDSSKIQAGNSMDSKYAMMMRKPFAIIKKEFLIAISYKLSFVFQLLPEFKLIPLPFVCRPPLSLFAELLQVWIITLRGIKYDRQ